MEKFEALVVNETEQGIGFGVEKVTLDDLSSGEVLIQVNYSSVNYKDMLAVQAKGGVIRNYPMIPGIDLSGTVVEAKGTRFSEGEEVLVTGFEMGMTHTGGFSQYARVPSEWVIPLPKGLNLKEAMIFGTAGLTAALSIAALESNGMNSALEQKIVVTGSTGGVGSLALQMLVKAGYKNVIALVRKERQIEVAKKLGASEVILSESIDDSPRPVKKQQYHFVLDTVGGEVASKLIPYIYYDGAMSLCGNAGGIKLTTTVLPFILRGVKLLGIDSVNISGEKRIEMWNKMASVWNIADQAVFQETDLDNLSDTIDALKQGNHLGRSIVKI